MFKNYSKFILLFILIQLITSLFVYYIYLERKNWLLNIRQENFQTNIENVIKIHEDTASIMFNLLQISQVIKIFEKTKDAPKEKLTEIRQELINILEKPYSKLQKYELRQLHFHLPNGDSFLRMHLPERYGDNLLEVRESIKKLVREKKIVRGYEVGRIFSGFRNIFPIFNDKQEYIGSLEISFAPTKILKEMAKDKIFLRLYEKESTLQHKLFIDQKYKYSNNILKGYNVELASSINPIDEKKMQELNEFIKEYFANMINKTENYITTINLDDTTYTLLLKPIRNIGGDQNAAYLLALEPNPVINRLQNLTSLLYLIFLAVHILVVLVTIRISKIRELKKLQSSLESRIQKEILANQNKDRIMFQQSKNAQMGEMLSMIAHQWRQPLNAIGAAAIRLNLEQELGQLTPEIICETSSFIQRKTQEMSQIINDFMNFFKPNSVKKYFSIAEALKEIEHLVSAQLQSRGIKCEHHIDKDIKLFGHQKELTHILLNFVSNARDAFEDNHIKDPLISIFVKKESPFVTIEVCDNAGGIRPDIIDNIFDPYFTTKEQGKGTGIGLFMVKQMIENDFKGKVNVQNIKNRGACFKLTLPIESEK